MFDRRREVVANYGCNTKTARQRGVNGGDYSNKGVSFCAGTFSWELFFFVC